jgi:hypothetical protein
VFGQLEVVLREISVESQDFEKLLAKDAPPPAKIWGGFPKYNFIGGHNDPETVPVLLPARVR